MTGKYVSLSAGLVFGMVMGLFLPFPLALALSVPTGVFFGLLGAWYDRG